MTDQTRLMSLYFGKHSSATDFSATPGTVYALRPDEGGGFLPLDYERLERNLIASDGKEYTDVIGAKMLDAQALTIPLSGINGSDGTAHDHLTDCEVGAMLDVIFGAAASDPTSTAVTASAITDDALTVSGTTIADGEVIAYNNGTEYVADIVTAGGGTTDLTVARNGSGSPTGTVLRGSVWTLQSATPQHVHGYFRSEGENWRRDWFGCMSSLTLNMPERQIVQMQTSWQPTDWSDVAEANPAFAEPAAGEYIVNVDASVWIGDTEFTARNLSLDLGYEVVARTTPKGPNGVNGYLVRRKRPILRGSLYFGTNADEISDGASTPSLADLTSGAATTRDVAVQIGRTAEKILYVRIPAAQFSARMEPQDGFAALSFEAKAKRPASGSMLTVALL